jgi:phage terminase Nu1 subunit (DNA packaging protein)
MALVDVTRVAQALNLTEQRVQQLVKEGLPREKRGQYDAVKCMLWYIRYLQAVIEKKAVNLGKEGSAGERQERVRLLRADADMREIELAKERSQLVALADVEASMTDLVLTTKARVMAIAPRLAPELVGETSRVMIEAKIEKSCKEALTLLAREGGSEYRSYKLCRRVDASAKTFKGGNRDGQNSEGE